MDDDTSFEQIQRQLEALYPDMAVTRQKVAGDTLLKSGYGGIRLWWIYRGSGEIFLPAGYRTQEGDGHALPGAYELEPMGEEFKQLLDTLGHGLRTLTEGAAVHVQVLLNRRRGRSFVGDSAAQLWGLDHVPRPWSSDSEVDECLVRLFALYRNHGYAVKRSDSWERIMTGDQIAVSGDEVIPVRGHFECLSMEKKGGTDRPISHARRLRYLLDTAGGCSFDFEPFRRLPLTWFLDYPGQLGDGINFVNSHVVNIPEELSSTHFHPFRSLRGGQPQSELYLVLDPAAYGIINKGRAPGLILYPDLTHLSEFLYYPLVPGDFVFIPPEVGHRGLNVLVNILTLPGFKPDNEFYIDQDIFDRTQAASPYNPNGLARKNYSRLEELLH